MSYNQWVEVDRQMFYRNFCFRPKSLDYSTMGKRWAIARLYTKSETISVIPNDVELIRHLHRRCREEMG